MKQNQTHVRVYTDDVRKLDALALRLGVNSTPKIISKLLEENSQLVNLTQSNYIRLVNIFKNYNFQSIDATVKFVLDQFERSNRKPCSIESIMCDNTARLVTGYPACGKTWWVRHTLLPYLKEQNTPTLIIDPLREYESVEQVGFDIFKFDLESFEGQLRYIPNEYSNLALAEVGNLFSTFEMRSNCLKRWCVIIEEAESYKDVPSVLKFVYESRHRCKKLVLVSAMLDSFKGILTVEVLPHVNA